MPDFANTITRAARTLTEQEQRKLLAVTGQRRDGWRDHVIFSVALGAGLREHEILALNVGDVFDDLGRARRRLALRVFKRASQEPAAQEVLLPDTVRAKLEKLLAMRKARAARVTSNHDDSRRFKYPRLHRRHIFSLRRRVIGELSLPRAKFHAVVARRVRRRGHPPVNIPVHIELRAAELPYRERIRSCPTP